MRSLPQIATLYNAHHKRAECAANLARENDKLVAAKATEDGTRSIVRKWVFIEFSYKRNFWPKFLLYENLVQGHAACLLSI